MDAINRACEAAQQHFQPGYWSDFQTEGVIVREGKGKPILCMHPDLPLAERRAITRFIAAAPLVAAVLRKVVAADDAALADLKLLGLPAEVEQASRALTEEARSALVAAFGSLP